MRSNCLEHLGLVVRVYIMIMATSLMINTTKPMLLSKAIDDLLLPLKLLFIPTHVIVMIIYIALRFIPYIVRKKHKESLKLKPAGVLTLKMVNLKIRLSHLQL